MTLSKVEQEESFDKYKNYVHATEWMLYFQPRWNWWHHDESDRSIWSQDRIFYLAFSIIFIIIIS